MDAITTCYIRILRLIWWTNVSSSAGNFEQKTSWIDSRRRAFWKVSLLWFDIYFRTSYYFRYMYNWHIEKIFQENEEEEKEATIGAWTTERCRNNKTVKGAGKAERRAWEAERMTLIYEDQCRCHTQNTRFPPDRTLDVMQYTCLQGTWRNAMLSVWISNI